MRDWRLGAFGLLVGLCVVTGQESPKPEQAKDEKKKWDVSNPPGPRSEISIDTETGTWLSLDVSPDGKEIAFDLLGDIYAIPITGGTARPLTRGMAWDMQPRYSPDGRRIAFTSDRGGGDNIWVMNRDGSSPKQVSKEEFRLLNSPAWSPDGQFIAARKHFTSRRSLGAGEIWLYHVSGGAGLQMTKKANDQKDVGEPVFSPDGRYLYYSLDATPGATFEYNKDPNVQIYAINRLDRETGDIDPFVTGPGGAVRPAPSPDGKQLAFIRRVRSRSVLYLHDAASGVERALYDGMERDMQETWAIHGVYPNLAWTPDSRSIVFWCGGKIRRIEAATRELSEIPFRVRDTRQVRDALRFPVEAAPPRFGVKMLRWVNVSPKGDAVVYQALGHLYMRALPEGTPRRLTNQSGHFENHPSFSRDGSFIVYTTWSDDRLGSIRIVPIEGGEGRTVTRQPGHYSDPSFSPDGKYIVYNKGAGRVVLAPEWSHDPGLYIVPAAGGEGKRISRSGLRPQFGARNDRVYVLTREGDKTQIKSMTLAGGDVRTHLVSDDATEIAVSPDGRWVAWRELFQAYVAPFPPTGHSITLGPKTTALPIKRLTRDAGNDLHWAGDSRRLYWALGPELYTRDLREAFAFLEGAPEKLPEPPEHGVNIGFTEPADVPSGRIALVGARIVTMRGDEVIGKGTVLVEGNRILAVGEQTKVKVPARTTTVNVAGKTIIPGLIDVHAHGPAGENGVVPQRNWAHYATLAFGTTTTHDPSNETNTVFAAAEMARAGAIVAPRIFSTGTILYGAGGSSRAEVNSLDDARSHVRRMKAVGAFSVKSYNQPRREQRQQIIAAARELGMMVVPEGGSLYEHNMTMVADGHTGIEHAVPVPRLYEDVLQFWPKTRTWYTPTLGVAYGGLWGENYWYQHTNVWENERLLRYVPRKIVDPRSRRRTMAPEDEFNHIRIARAAKQLLDRGLRVQLGAHGQMQGLAPHWELWMFVQGGMTPHQALRAGTLYGAQYLGLDNDLGSIEPGKLADLAVLDRNPLANIRDSEYVRYVMINGRLFETDTMNEAGNHPRKRGRFFFE
ncbi:MAG: PD40 domain-containing protein [Acidobacteria bacterium]|nr:PD40 domain-containing protein [Acidobacteriota bacterium]